ncbi:hypothetical protein CBF23_011395 [Marinomonas agarivorans]|nr:hypothetical protein CBF23_011395 [Marinomonas agarivorans]
MNEFLDLRINTVHYRGNRGGVILSGNCMLSGNRYIASINRDELVDLPIIRKGKIWRLWGVEKECELQFPGANVQENMIYVSQAQNLSSTYENLINFIVDEEKISLSESRHLLEHFEGNLRQAIIDNDIEALSNVLPEKKATILCETFASANIQEAVKFLERLGLSQSIAKKVVEMYGRESISKIITDPYRLLSFGVAWSEVDHFATNHCYIDSKSELRLSAAVEEALYRACDDGSTAIKLKDLRLVLNGVLNSTSLVHKALSLNGVSAQYRAIDNFYYPAGGWLIEQRIAQWVIEKKKEPVKELFTTPQLKQIIDDFQQLETLTFSSVQKKALKLCSSTNLNLLIGANGVGKNKILQCLYRGVVKFHPDMPLYRISLNGKLVNAMNSIDGVNNQTVSGFVKYMRRHAIEQDMMLVIEEANMIDNVQFYRLINQLPKGCRLILVGDNKQLSPLGVGSILQALSETDIAKTVLKDKYDVPENGTIDYVLESIRQGIWRGIKAYTDDLSGVGFVSCSNSDIDHNVLELYKRLSDEDPDTQVICPTQSGSGGADTLNALIQPLANTSLEELTYVDSEFGFMSYRSNTGPFTVGDKVVYTKCNENNELRDGSLGEIIKQLNPNKSNSPICKIDFGVDGVHNFKPEDLEDLEMAYAITAHRAQGYRFKNVIIPVRQSRSLDRSLLYAAISCGVERVILVGNREAAINAVEKFATSTRTVGLAKLIVGVK